MKRSLKGSEHSRGNMRRNEDQIPTEIIELLEDLTLENLETAEMILAVPTLVDDVSIDLTALRPAKVH